MTAEDYRKEIAELFDKWKNKPEKDGINHIGNTFVSDGIVNPETWFSNEIRPLFLLKEAYSEGETDDWDLINEWLKTDNSLGLTWRRVSQWTYGVLETTTDSIPAFKKSSVYGKGKNEWLNQIAVMNIKKSNGKKESEETDLMKYAKNDREQLFDQLKITSPTVIICGNTLKYLGTITGQKIKTKRNDNWYYEIELDGKKIMVLDYFHPANQYPDLLNFYGLVSIYQQALKNK